MDSFSESFDAVVIGAGILGLASSYCFARKGKRVCVIERSQQATGASVRNFGMVWPIGQPPGEMREIALRSRDIWLDFLAESGIWHRPCGSMHLAYAPEELGVLEEFVSLVEHENYRASIISSEEALAHSPHIRPEGLLGALYSPDEVCVFPRQVIAEAPAFLQKKYGVEFRFGTAATDVEPGKLVAGGKSISAQQILICNGDDFETLLPEFYASSGLTRCKLQMLRARPKHSNFQLGTHLCAGLTLAHYPNFKITLRLASLIEKMGAQWPGQAQNGIHLLVSQHQDGCLTIGDSHHYGLAVDPFLSEEVEQLMLEYLDTFLPVDQLEVFERWIGVYAKHPQKSYVLEKTLPGVGVLNGVGGAGMTLSFGLAERAVNLLSN